jgi:hypothetical protein
VGGLGRSPLGLVLSHSPSVAQRGQGGDSRRGTYEGYTDRRKGDECRRDYAAQMIAPWTVTRTRTGSFTRTTPTGRCARYFGPMTCGDSRPAWRASIIVPTQGPSLSRPRVHCPDPGSNFEPGPGAVKPHDRTSAGSFQRPKFGSAVPVTFMITENGRLRGPGYRFWVDEYAPAAGEDALVPNHRCPDPGRER